MLQVTGPIATDSGTQTVVPVGATGVATNVTVVDGQTGTSAGYVTVYPCGARPNASNLNFTNGQIIPNAVTSSLSLTGTICLYVYGSAYLLVDVVGYYVPSSGGEPGPPGPAGASAVKITELSVCDGSDVDTTADELCKIGMTGPGGGPVFYIDYFDQYASFCASGDCNYLEAAHDDVDEDGGDFLSSWCSINYVLFDIPAWEYGAVGAGRTNTAGAAICTSGAIRTAIDYVSPVFNGVAKYDWWLPSIGELMLMQTNLRQIGAGDLSAFNSYWSSTELTDLHAMSVVFSTGSSEIAGKSNQFRVRPVRAF